MVVLDDFNPLVPRVVLYKRWFFWGYFLKNFFVEIRDSINNILPCKCKHSLTLTRLKALCGCIVYYVFGAI